MKVNNRDKNRFIREILIMAIILAIVGLTVSYAAVNVTLDIAGFSSARVASWNIRFVDTEVTEKKGSAVVIKDPVIRGTNITYGVRLEEEGDSVTIKAVIKNAGNMNAKLDSYLISGIPDEYKDNVSYTVTDESGNSLKTGRVIRGGNATQLEKYMTVYITIAYKNMIPAGEGYKTFDL